MVMDRDDAGWMVTLRLQEGERTSMFYVARFLMKMQSMFGIIPKIKGKGHAAKVCTTFGFDSNVIRMTLSVDCYQHDVENEERNQLQRTQHHPTRNRYVGFDRQRCGYPP